MPNSLRVFSTFLFKELILSSYTLVVSVVFQAYLCRSIIKTMSKMNYCQSFTIKRHPQRSHVDYKQPTHGDWKYNGHLKKDVACRYKNKTPSVDQSCTPKMTYKRRNYDVTLRSGIQSIPKISYSMYLHVSIVSYFLFDNHISLLISILRFKICTLMFFVFLLSLSTPLLHLPHPPLHSAPSSILQPSPFHLKPCPLN